MAGPRTPLTPRLPVGLGFVCQRLGGKGGSSVKRLLLITLLLSACSRSTTIVVAKSAPNPRARSSASPALSVDQARGTFCADLTNSQSTLTSTTMMSMVSSTAGPILALGNKLQGDVDNMTAAGDPDAAVVQTYVSEVRTLGLQILGSKTSDLQKDMRQRAALIQRLANDVKPVVSMCVALQNAASPSP